jgi:uncharacterized membrane protein YhaH (DUF805 family)
MQGSLDQPPIRVRARRWQGRRMFAFAVLPLILVSQAARADWDPGRLAHNPMLWAIVAVLALNLVVLGWILLAPPVLELSPSGIVYRAVLRTRRWSWADISDFRAVRYGGVDAVGFHYVGGKKRTSNASQTLERITGAQGMLASNMETPGDELAGLLNRARAQWCDAATVAPAEAAPRLTAVVLSGVFALLGGRIGRRFYWTTVVLTSVSAAAVSLLPSSAVYGPVAGVVIWLLLGRARMRDTGRSPLWLNVPWIVAVLAMMVLMRLGWGPYAGVAAGAAIMIAAVVVVGLAPGDPNSNRFGPPPGGEKDNLTPVFS